MKILAIETSCDETSVSVMEGDEKNQKIKVVSNIVSSQVEIHNQWGGVVPNIAAREHLKNIIPVINESLEASKTSFKDIDIFAVTEGPGLIPALLIGTNAAKTLGYFFKKPLVGVQHIEGHIYANFIDTEEDKQISFPALILVASGGHTQLMLMKGHMDFEIIGQTQDDAVGEAFDKVAKILNLGYPGGPTVSKRAANFESWQPQNPDFKRQLEEIIFPKPMINSGDYNFSFSGLKTAVLYYVKNNLDTFEGEEKERLIDAICFAFEKSVTEVLIAKTLRAIDQYNPKTVMMAGGVAANQKLRNEMKDKITALFPQTNFIKPEIKYCGDNAAMIGAGAFFKYLFEENKTKFSNTWKTLEANANLKVGK